MEGVGGWAGSRGDTRRGGGSRGAAPGGGGRGCGEKGTGAAPPRRSRGWAAPAKGPRCGPARRERPARFLVAGLRVPAGESQDKR